MVVVKPSYSPPQSPRIASYIHRTLTAGWDKAERSANKKRRKTDGFRSFSLFFVSLAVWDRCRHQQKNPAILIFSRETQETHGFFRTSTYWDISQKAEVARFVVLRPSRISPLWRLQIWLDMRWNHLDESLSGFKTWIFATQNSTSTCGEGSRPKGLYNSFFQPWVVNNHHLDSWHVLMILPKLKMAVGFFLTLQSLQKAGG